MRGGARVGCDFGCGAGLVSWLGRGMSLGPGRLRARFAPQGPHFRPEAATTLRRPSPIEQTRSSAPVGTIHRPSPVGRTRGPPVGGTHRRRIGGRAHERRPCARQDWAAANWRAARGCPDRNQAGPRMGPRQRALQANSSDATLASRPGEGAPPPAKPHRHPHDWAKVDKKTTPPRRARTAGNGVTNWREHEPPLAEIRRDGRSCHGASGVMRCRRTG
jgi:hypothetical protein